LRLPASGRHEDLNAALDDRLHLHLMPVAGVGDDDAGRVGHAGAGQLGFDGENHRVEVPEVR